MLTDAQREAQKRYTSRMKTVTVRLDPERDQDIVQWLDSQPEKRAYIMSLVREDMKRNL